mmetsp:Transcript_19687/g.41495  ORF Transcript_19687/g.41495 Transcript_19687/m.41495 type:complete len:239 (-) Transcript_19687:212-928(-)
MRFAAAALVTLLIQQPAPSSFAFSPAPKFSAVDGFSSASVGGDLATRNDYGMAREVGTSLFMSEHDLDNATTDADMTDRARGDAAEIRRARAIASILGVATAQVHATKAFAAGLFGLSGAIFTAGAGDFNFLQGTHQNRLDTHQIKFDSSSVSYGILNKQSMSPIETAPLSQISLPSNVLADENLLAEETEIEVSLPAESEIDVSLPVEQAESFVESIIDKMTGSQEKLSPNISKRQR